MILKFVIFYTLYIIYSSRIDQANLLLGLINSGVLILFLMKIDKYSKEIYVNISKKYNYIKFIMIFIPVLIKDVLVSSFEVTMKIWEVNINISPSIHDTHVKTTNESLLALLSWSITLTPGTLSLSSSSDTIVVHSLSGCFQTSDIEKLLYNTFNTISKSKNHA